MTRTVGTAAEVVDTFLHGHLNGYGSPTVTRTPLDSVPGGRRVRVEPWTGDLDTGPADAVALYSYRTIVAIRTSEGAFAVTPQRYGPSTGKLLGRVRRGIERMSFKVDGGVVPVTVAVPGRWGGFGPAWHATGFETLPFILYT